MAAAVLLGSVLAACGGGGSSLPSATTPSAPSTPATTPKQSVSFTLTVPPSSSSAVRTRKYLPSQTQSFSIVETDNGGAPGTPIVQNTAPGSPNCTSGPNGTTCTVTVAANIGSDVFTVNAYDAPNAGGNLLASGTVAGTVKAGVANSFPLTLTGQVASVALTTTEAFPKVGTSTVIAVQAKDADNNTIIGSYNAPVTLSVNGANATLTQSSFATSSGSATLALASTQTAAFNVTASFNGHTSNLAIAPASNVIYYNVGSGANDYMGFGITAGTDGNLYYTTGNANASAGNLGQFNPATGAFSEVATAGFPVDPYQTADGTVWVGYNVYPSGYVAKIPAGSFNAASLTPIALPTVSPAPNSYGSKPRTIAQGSDGNLYLTDTGNGVMYKFASTAAAQSDITKVPLPRVTPPANPVYPAGSVITRAQGIAAGTDGNLYIANNQYYAPSLEQYNPSTGALTNILAPYAPQAMDPRFVAAGSDGNIYVSFADQCSVSPCAGGLASYSPATGAFTALGVPRGISEPDHIAAGNGQVAWADLADGGFGVYLPASNDLRYYPTTSTAQILAGVDSAGKSIGGADGVAYANGELWVMSYGPQQRGGALQIEHAVVTGAWSVLPSQSISLVGTGLQNAQMVGLMENGSSGPFTTTTSNGSCASLQAVPGASHNFYLVGSAAGNCTVTITDAHGRSESIAVTVTSTTGTVMSRQHNGGSI
ncbi:MAG TPA: hypothetical protein VFL13_02730 [Candidatus Baltobacteraceae bacterium]|nr:hypothetical protein [Candidatus Baltobacteraceae bacterium]